MNAGRRAIETIRVHGAVQRLAGIADIVGENSGGAQELRFRSVALLAKLDHGVEDLPDAERQRAHVHGLALALVGGGLRSGAIEIEPLVEIEPPRRRAAEVEQSPRSE